MRGPAVAAALAAALLLPVLAPPAHANNPPRGLRGRTGNPGNVCALAISEWGATIASPAGTLVSIKPLTGRRGETTAWPTICTRTSEPAAPYFDDVDGDTLTLTHSVRLPANVRERASRVTQQTATADGIVFFQGVAAYRKTDTRVYVTATDPHGASLTRYFIFQVGTFDGSSAPSLTAVADQQLKPHEAMTALELPAATGGDTTWGTSPTETFPYVYEVSGLPPGLRFDPATRTISGTPVESGTYSVTYTADDADGESASLNPEETDATDTASRTFTITVSGTASTPTIDVVRIVSHPTYDADSNGSLDTYVRGDEILVDVEYSEPVKVVNAGTNNGNVKLRLDMGDDDATLTNSRKVITLKSVLYGGRTLRFAYKVQASDTDADGLWVQTAGSDNVVFLTGSPAATIESVDSGTSAGRSISGLPTTGDARTKVDGSKTAPAGPRPTEAEVDGDTLTVTFNEALKVTNTQQLIWNLEVQVSSVHGGHRNAQQHPSAVSASGSMLTLTLGSPAQPGDRVTLTHVYAGSNKPLRDTSDNVAAAFRDFAVTNVTGGPSPVRAFAAGKSLTLEFDGDLDPASAPAGNAFVVHATDRDDDLRRIFGTGTAAVAGSSATVTLQHGVGRDELASVTYTPPASAPLQGLASGTPRVAGFGRFRVEAVHDVTPPTTSGAYPITTSATAGSEESRVLFVYDEPLDTASVPATTDFTVTPAGGTAQTVSSVAINGRGVVLTLDGVAWTFRQSVATTYTPGTNPIKDPAGNAAAGFSFSDEALRGTGTQRVSPVTPGVDGAVLSILFSDRIDPASVPAASAFTFSDDFVIGIARIEPRAVWLDLHLEHPVYPCAPSFTVTYTKPTGAGAKPIKSLDGAEAAGFTKNVDNRRASQCATRQVSGMGGRPGDRRPVWEQKSVTLDFGRTLDTGKTLQAEAFTLSGASGASAPAVQGASFTSDGKGVALALDRALAAGEQVTASYARPARTAGLWDGAGNQIADFSGVTVRNEAVPAADLPVLSVSDARAAEGEALEFTVSLSAAGASEVTVDYATSDGTAASGTDYTAEARTLRLPADNTSATLFVYSTGDEEAEDDETFTLTLSNASGATLGTASATGTIEDDDGAEETEETAAAALTAGFEGLPSAHDGGRLFGFEVVFSEEFEGLRLTAFEAGALAVTNGRLVDAKRATRGENRRVAVRVRPSSDEAMTLTLAATTDCAAATAICAADGRMLSGPVSATVSGPGNAVATGAPGITGTAQAGETLTATTDGIADADGLTGATFAFQWVSNADGSDTDISGATDASYTLGNGDVGAAIKVRVRFTDDAGNSEELTSAPTAPVAARGNRPATGAPAISGTAQAGETLTATTGGISDADGLSNATFAFQWVSSQGGSDTDIAGATGSSYTLGDGDVGATIKVRASFTDDAGNRESLTSAATATVEARPNSPATGAPAISGTAQAGETLTASTDGISDADGLSGATFAFQWVSNADGNYADISGATGSSYTLGDGDVGAALKVRASFTDDAGNRESLTSAATARVTAPPLTAEFTGMPSEHDGSEPFTFELTFSDEVQLSYRALKDGTALSVENGRATKAKRIVAGENRRWRITVRPASHGDVAITLPAGAVSTASGRTLSNTVSARVIGPVGISVSDARVREGAGAVLSFAVTLSRSATSGFSVRYATSDGTATAGADYTAASGTLSFTAGQSSGTIEVAVLDDDHDEGEETLTLRLRNPSGAWVDDGEAIGTIENADLIPAALLARFGRAAAEQVVETVEERLAAPRRRGFTARLAGREFTPGNERAFALGFLTQFAPVAPGAPAGGGAGAAAPAMGSHAAGLGSLGRGADTTGMGGGTGAAGMGGGAHSAGMGAGTMGQRRSMNGADHGGPFGPLGGDLFSSSGFELNRESRGGMLSVWSRSARSYFSGMEDALSLNGDVRTTMVGADWVRGPLTLGLSVGHSLGLGGYAGASGGQMSTSLTGFYPWVGYQVNDRVSVWGVTGYGKGSLSLTPDGAEALETGVSMAMTAVGTRGELLGPGTGGGFSLAFKADALWVGAASALLESSAGRLNASEAGVTRVRTALEGSRGFTLGDGRVSLTPSVEVGVRRDGGDAETGAGLDVGGGFAFADAVTGMSLDVRVRTLVVHEAEGFNERGLSLSFGWNPTPSSPLGLSARVAPSWGGSAQGGAEALWSGQMAYGMGSPSLYGSAGQLDAEVGYGLPVGARLVGTPTLGLRTSGNGRDYRAAYSLGVLEQGRLHFDLGVEAQRRENRMYGEAGGAFLARATLGW